MQSSLTGPPTGSGTGERVSPRPPPASAQGVPAQRRAWVGAWQVFGRWLLARTDASASAHSPMQTSGRTCVRVSDAGAVGPGRRAAQAGEPGASGGHGSAQVRPWGAYLAASLILWGLIPRSKDTGSCLQLTFTFSVT